MSNEFAGLVAIVTGGASGIGAAIVERLSGAGAQVAVFDLNTESVPEGIFATRVDISDTESVNSGVQEVADRFGRIDIVVNNAGMGAQGTIESNSDAEWMRVLNVNVLGLVRVSRAALPWLRKSPAAAIVNTGSIAVTAGIPNRALYGASKGAVYSLTLQMAADHLREGIRVNCVNPGTADTPWVQRLLATADDPVAERAALEKRQPHSRLVAPSEVAEAVAYLASPRSGSTTGTAIAVDGGMDGLRLRPAE